MMCLDIRLDVLDNVIVVAAELEVGSKGDRLIPSLFWCGFGAWAVESGQDEGHGDCGGFDRRWGWVLLVPVL